MLSITSVVEDILRGSEEASLALRGGYLNLNAYARVIRAEVEARAKKPVRVGSIVVALSRLRGVLKRDKPLLPAVVVEDLSVRSGLMEFTFNRTNDNMARLRELYQDASLRNSDFLALSQGIGEITIIATSSVANRIRQRFGRQQPKAVIAGLASLTVRLSDDYIQTPNVIYALMRSLAMKRLNVIEVVSTYTELTFVVDEHDIERALATVNSSFKRK